MINTKKSLRDTLGTKTEEIKMKKRILSALLALTMILTIFAGCNNNTPSKDTSKKDVSKTESTETDGDDESKVDVDTAIDFDEDPYEINYLYLVSQEGPSQGKVNQAVNDLALKELNMTVNMIPMTFGTYNQQLTMMLAANEPLDIFPTMSNNFSTFIESQYVVNMDDYLDYAPDAIEVLGEDAFAGYIGDFLIGFSQMKERAYPAGLIVRKDIFDELGYKVEDFDVSTDDYSSWDKITEMFSKVKEAYPNMVCLDGTGTMGTQALSYVDNLGSGDFGVLEDYGRTKTVTNWFESEEFGAFARINREWFTNGYSSADIAVNQESGETKLRAGNAFSMICPYKPNTAIEKEAQTGYAVEVIPMGIPVKKTSAVTGSLFSIANASKDPKKAMQFMNWTYKSGDFNNIINWGIEGEDFVVNSDGLAEYPEGVDATNVGYHNDFGWIYPNQFAGYPWVGNPKDIWDQYRKYNGDMELSEAFGFIFDSTAVANEEAQLNSVSEQYLKDVAFGAVDPETGIKEFNEALYAAGLQTVIDEKQRQLDEWLANN